MNAKAFLLPFLRKEQIANNIFSFYFKRLEDTPDFLPGQYIRLTLPHTNSDERGTSRYFTIASSPLQKEIIITTRIERSSFKKTLLNLTKGTTVKFFGPMGNFLLPENNLIPCVFIAGGISITPYHSMINYAHEKNFSLPITLFVTFSTINEVIYYKELTLIAQKNPHIKIIYSVSKANSLWTGEQGRISEELIKKYVQDVSKPIFYLVGSSKMIETIKEILIRMNIHDERIKIEEFTGY